MIRDDDDGVDEQLNREGRKFKELKGGQVALLKQINKFVIAKIDFFLIQSKVSFVFFIYALCDGVSWCIKSSYRSKLKLNRSKDNE